MPLALKMTAVYIAINALIMLVLGINVMRMRGRTRTTLGHGDKPEMLQAIRAHANNTEYVPIVLILLLTVRLLGGTLILVHAIGLTLTAGRLIHAYALLSPELWNRQGPGAARVLGMALTQIALVIGIAAALWLAFSAPG